MLPIKCWGDELDGWEVDWLGTGLDVAGWGGEVVIWCSEELLRRSTWKQSRNTHWTSLWSYYAEKPSAVHKQLKQLIATARKGFRGSLASPMLDLSFRTPFQPHAVHFQCSHLSTLDSNPSVLCLMASFVISTWSPSVCSEMHVHARCVYMYMCGWWHKMEQNYVVW